MNCKPGDLVVIVRCLLVPQAVGFITRVVRFQAASNGKAAWRIDPPVGKGSLIKEGRKYMLDWVWDASLRPIRPQDDDAEDQSKAWLPPVPTKEHA